jgi:choline dehydrogenase-like flavoprotein
MRLPLRQNCPKYCRWGLTVMLELRNMIGRKLYVEGRIDQSRRLFLAKLGSTMALLLTPVLSLPSQAGQNSTSKGLPGRFGDIDENTMFDVCIIGSGFAGAVLGCSLVTHGIKTVVLESGVDLRHQSPDPRFEKLEVFRSSGPIDYPIVATRFRSVGGTSWMWAGTCPRLHPMDFENNSYTPAGATWPITYTELEPYYEEAEKTLRVRGGRQSEYHPPRKADYPLPPDRDHSTLKGIFNEVGVIVSDMPTSTPEDVHRRSSFPSGRYGPPLRITEVHIPRFQASPHAALIAEATVNRLRIDRAGRIVGAEMRDLERNMKIVRARVYVVACGGLESPRLLILSRSPHFPNGIGNNHDWVGRCFMEHRNIYVRGRIKAGWSNFNSYPRIGSSYQFYKEFKQQGLGGIIPYFHLSWVKKADLDKREFIKAFKGIWRPELMIVVEPEMQANPVNRVTLDKDLKDYFGNPVTNLFLSESELDLKTVDHAKKLVRRIYSDLNAEEVGEINRGWGHHHMGTCRMGDNPQTSVVDRNLRVHGTTNLFVAGSSVFVTSGAANPTLTLTALSLRLGDYLYAQLRDGKFVVD